MAVTKTSQRGSQPVHANLTQTEETAYCEIENLGEGVSTLLMPIYNRTTLLLFQVPLENYRGQIRIHLRFIVSISSMPAVKIWM